MNSPRITATRSSGRPLSWLGIGGNLISEAPKALGDSLIASCKSQEFLITLGRLQLHRSYRAVFLCLRWSDCLPGSCSRYCSLFLHGTTEGALAGCSPRSSPQKRLFGRL